jgi:hypothetical protein
MAALMLAFLLALSGIPLVLCAAWVNRALISGEPAPGALLLLRKMVTCFSHFYYKVKILAAVAITITDILPVPGIINCAGFILIHCYRYSQSSICFSLRHLLFHLD